MAAWISVGGAIIGGILGGVFADYFGRRRTLITAIVLYAAFMLGVCLLACIVPTRRALQVQPTEALRADG